MKVKQKRKTCNNGLQFLGREVNHNKPKPYDEKKTCNKRLQFSGREIKVQIKIQRDNCMLRQQAKVNTYPDPVMKEVGNEKKEAGNQQETKTPSPKARN